MTLRLITLASMLALASVAEAQEIRKAGDNPKAVLPSMRRLDAIKKADEFLALSPANSEELTASLADPFYPEVKRLRDKKPGTDEPAVVVPPEVLLARAAEIIRPQGTMIIGSEPYLLFENNKRYKAGDVIPVTIDGVGVQVTIISIQRNSYTLRLNDQELRREFK